MTDIEIIEQSLRAEGITSFDIRNGNNCYWVSYGMINAYYYVKDGKIINVIFD